MRRSPFQRLSALVAAATLAWSGVAMAGPPEEPPIADPFENPHPDAGSEMPVPEQQPGEEMPVPEGPAPSTGSDPTAAPGIAPGQPGVAQPNAAMLQALQPKKGNGLLITGGILLGLGVLGHGGGIAIIRNGCLENLPEVDTESITEMEAEEAAESAELLLEQSASFAGGCLLSGLGGGAMVFVFGTMQFVGGPLAIGGAAMRGRYEAYQSVAIRREARKKQAVFMATGGSLLGLGTITWLGAGGAIRRAVCPTPTVSNADLESDPTLALDLIDQTASSMGCRLSMYGATFNLGSLMVWGGSSLLAYGAQYNRHYRKFQTMFPMSFTPTFAPGRVGLGINGRF